MGGAWAEASRARGLRPVWEWDPAAGEVPEGWVDPNQVFGWGVELVDLDLDDPAHPVGVESRTVGTWRFLTLHHEVNDSRDIADLDLNLDQLTAKDRTVVQLGLVGTLTVTDRAALDVCLDRHARLFAFLGTWDRHTDIAVMPADDEFEDLGIGGFAADAVAELVHTARSDGAGAEAARGALALLLRLKEGAA